MSTVGCDCGGGPDSESGREADLEGLYGDDTRGGVDRQVAALGGPAVVLP